jgi:hypothetical protein
MKVKRDIKSSAAPLSFRLPFIAVQNLFQPHPETMKLIKSMPYHSH